MRAIFLSLFVLIIIKFGHAQTITFDAFGVFAGNDYDRAQWAGERRICNQDNCKSEIMTNTKVYEVALFYGEKSVKVNEGEAMSLGLFQDEFGNLIRKSEATAWTENGTRSANYEVTDGIGSTIFKAGKSAGIAKASLISESKQSTSQTYRNLADLESIQLAVETPKDDAQQHEIYRFKSTNLIDRYGNPAPVGFATWIIMQNAKDQQAYIPFIANQELATEVIHTTTMNGKYQYRLYSTYQTSGIFELEIHPENLIAVQDFDIELEVSTDVLIVKICGMQTDKKQLIEDATPVNATITEANGRSKTYQLWTLDGNAVGRFAIQPDAFPVELKASTGVGTVVHIIHKDEVRLVQ